MYKTGRIETDTRPSDLYLSYAPAVFAAVFVILGIAFIFQQDQTLQNRTNGEDSRRLLTQLHLGIESRLEHDMYVVESTSQTMSERVTNTPDQLDTVTQALLALSNSFDEVAIVQDGIVTNRSSRDSTHTLSVGTSFDDWKTSNAITTAGRSLRGTIFSNIVSQPNGRKCIVLQTPIETGLATSVVVLINIEEVLVQAGALHIKNHTVTIRDATSGTYIFGTSTIDMTDAISEMLIVGDLRWVLQSIRTGAVNGNEVVTRSISHFSIGILGLLVIGPTAWVCHLLHTKHHSQLVDRRREKRLEALTTRLGIALEASNIGIFQVDANTRQVSWDDRTYELFAMSPSDDAQSLRSWWKKIHPKDRGRAINDFRVVLSGRPRVESEFRIRLPDHSERHVRSIWSSVQTDGDRLLLNAQWDVTAENKKTEELIHAHRVAVKRNKDLLRAKDQLEYMALHDPMTGLPNRRYFEEYVAELGAPRTTGKRVVGIIQIDLDSFKQVNDSHGHAAGDKVLAHAARAIDRCCRDEDFVARTGGDEFVLFCCRDLGDAANLDAELARLAQRIIAAVQHPMIIKGKIYKPAVSIGIAPVKTTKTSWLGFLAQADAALYQAKGIGRNRYAFHTGLQAPESFELIRSTEDIFSAIEQSQFIPAYQPQFHASDQRLVGIEALARWHHPIRGVLTPEAFMPAAKQLKLEAEIDAQIMEHTLRDIETWRTSGLQVPKIAVNISPRRLCSDELIDELRTLSIPKGTLSFELLESIFVGEDDDQLINNVRSIKELGIDIEIDDFGTGFASIVSLLRLEPNRLKIDRSLVSPVLENHANRQVLRSVVEMARALNIQVLAEGVESQLQARVLRTIGCDALQGFALGKPMPMEQMTRFLGTVQVSDRQAAVEI